MSSSAMSATASENASGTAATVSTDSPQQSIVGPPYPPQTAQLGLAPFPVPDIPVSGVLLALFVAAGAANMRVYRRNRRRSYKFLFSALLMVFCAARTVALALRIAWAAEGGDPGDVRDSPRPTVVRLAVAAQIFTAAGVLLLFVTNLVFAQRVVRAYHPFFGWSKPVSALFWALFASAVIVLILVVTVTVQGFFIAPPPPPGSEGVGGGGGGGGDDTKKREVVRKVQLVCATYLAVYAFLPVPLVTLAAAVPRRTRIDKFGEGHFRTKFALLTFTATLLAAGATFRAVVAFYPRPVDRPAWFHGRACYYCFNYVIELIVVFTYALSRFDKRFHIPDGSSAPGHYSRAELGMAGSGALVSQAVSERDERRRGRASGWGKRRADSDQTFAKEMPSEPWRTATGRSARSLPSIIRPASSVYGCNICFPVKYGVHIETRPDQPGEPAWEPAWGSGVEWLSKARDRIKFPTGATWDRRMSETYEELPLSDAKIEQGEVWLWTI
ncbi:hypothetical protein VTI28DRAFT_1853 [Corynascus sepedonium]